MSDSTNTAIAQPIEVTRQQSLDAARAVASYCLLPDPRPHFANAKNLGARVRDWLTTSVNEYDVDACARRQINGKIWDTSPQPGRQHLLPSDPRYRAILSDAAARAAIGAAQCEWREFDDAKDEPYHYSGRIINNQCTPGRGRR